MASSNRHGLQQIRSDVSESYTAGIFCNSGIRDLSLLNHVIPSPQITNTECQSFIVGRPAAINIFYNSSDSTDNVETVSCNAGSFFVNQLCFTSSVLKKACQ